MRHFQYYVLNAPIIIHNPHKKVLKDVFTLDNLIREIQLESNSQIDIYIFAFIINCKLYREFNQSPFRVEDICTKLEEICHQNNIDNIQINILYVSQLRTIPSSVPALSVNEIDDIINYSKPSYMSVTKIHLDDCDTDSENIKEIFSIAYNSNEPLTTDVLIDTFIIPKRKNIIYLDHKPTFTDWDRE